MEDKRTYVWATPSTDDRQMDAWVTVAGHYILKDYNAPLRSRKQTLLGYCLRGSGSIGIGDVEYTFRRGDVFIQPAHIAHTCYSNPEEGWEVWWIIFGGSYAHKLLERSGLSATHPLLSLGVYPELEGHFRDIYGFLEQKTIHTQLDACRSLLSLLLNIRKMHSTHQVDILRPFQGINYQTRSLDELVAESGYSKHHYIRLFKRATGVTPWAYVLLLKIDKAKELLLDPQLTVKEVALQVGIDNSLYFSRLFRKSTGVSPRQFRKEMQREQ